MNTEVKKYTQADIDGMADAKALKVFFQRKDRFSPNGQDITIKDMQSLSGEERKQYAAQAKAELLNPTVEVFA